MFKEEEELLLKNPDDDSASGSVDTTSTPTRRGRKRSGSSLVAQRSKMLNKKEREFVTAHLLSIPLLENVKKAFQEQDYCWINQH